VWCTGVLYHTPNPVHQLMQLREITGEVLFLGTHTIPEVTGVEQACLYYPHLSADARRDCVYDTWAQIAAPFACIIITLFAIPAGIASGRQSVFRGILGALGMYFSFYGLTILMMVLAKNGLFPAIPAVFLPIAVFFVLGLRLFWRQR
jgi:lipopolysaccharide export LptBFGC system permease protein LptF